MPLVYMHCTCSMCIHCVILTHTHIHKHEQQREAMAASTEVVRKRDHLQQRTLHLEARLPNLEQVTLGIFGSITVFTLGIHV